MGLSAKRDRLAVEYRKNEYGEFGGPFYAHKMDLAFLAGFDTASAEAAPLVEALEKYAEFDGEYRWISLTAREALAKYRKGGAIT